MQSQRIKSAAPENACLVRHPARKKWLTARGVAERARTCNPGEPVQAPGSSAARRSGTPTRSAGKEVLLFGAANRPTTRPAPDHSSQRACAWQVGGRSRDM
jgi:hypothetical protein